LALAWLNEQTEIPTLSELQTDVRADLDKLGATALNTGNDWAIPLLGITYAASEALLPTSTLDILPVGKAAKVGKLADDVDEAESAAKQIDDVVGVVPNADIAPNKLNLTYPVETKPNTAFFWSGKTEGVGGEAVARQIATDNKGTTLEALIENRNIQMPAWDATNPEVVKAWKAVSADYATGSTGTVRAVIGQNLRQGNVWETAELPALMKNPNVDRIITIDPVTKIEAEIFVRGK
jgi:hypothetical protein